MTQVKEGTLLWSPTETRISGSNITQFATYASKRTGRRFDTYEDLWRWSVEDLEDFWEMVWKFYQIEGSEYSAVLAGENLEDASWFPGAELNYAEHIFRNGTTERPAIIFTSERETLREIPWSELIQTTKAIRAYLVSEGIQPGDCVASYMPNIPETIAAFLATSSLGAIWSSCSPDFGARSVVDRFSQIEPKVLIAADGYQYGGVSYDRRTQIADLQAALPSLNTTILFRYLDSKADLNGLHNTVTWSQAASTQYDSLEFERVSFEHPLWVVYSSGTTGLPKPIVHGHGGVLLEHLKMASLHFDQDTSDRFFWFSSTGWMMWNLVVSTLLTGATIVLYDGSPAYPDMWTLWDIAARSNLTFLGLSAAYIVACMAEKIDPSSRHQLESLKAVGSTGSPLPPSGFAWLYRNVKRELWVTSASGGTDIVSGLVAGVPTLPVRAGEIQCRCLGARVEAFDQYGVPRIGTVGELVVTAPMPSMPVFLWGDDDGSLYHESYFSMFPGIWRHGDWIRITEEGGVFVYGRSDSTINRKGVRIGTAEMYAVIEDIAEITDSLVVDVGEDHNTALLVAFVVVAPCHALDSALRSRIRQAISEHLSPRHTPDRIIAIPEVPRTLNGKKLEVPIKRILQGSDVEDVISLDAMSNPESLSHILDLAESSFQKVTED